MQTALCPTSPQSVLETAVSHAYPEQGRDNVALYCLSVHTPCGKGARHKNIVLPRTLTWLMKNKI